MTLGGLALAVGILVDDATVEIENVHRNMGIKGRRWFARFWMARRRSLSRRLSRRYASASCSSRCCMLTGAAKYLFTPLAMAVVFAMLTSYLLTRTWSRRWFITCCNPRWSCTRTAKERTIQRPGPPA